MSFYDLILTNIRVIFALVQVNKMPISTTSSKENLSFRTFYIESLTFWFKINIKCNSKCHRYRRLLRHHESYIIVRPRNRFPTRTKMLYEIMCSPDQQK